MLYTETNNYIFLRSNPKKDIIVRMIKLQNAFMKQKYGNGYFKN